MDELDITDLMTDGRSDNEGHGLKSEACPYPLFRPHDNYGINTERAARGDQRGYT